MPDEPPEQSQQPQVIAGAVFEKVSSEDEAREATDQRLSLPETSNLDSPVEKPYDQLKALDDARWKLARGLLLTLVLVIILTVTLVATVKLTGVLTADVSRMFETMFTALVTLLSAATGFYFGARVESGTTTRNSASSQRSSPSQRPRQNPLARRN